MLDEKLLVFVLGAPGAGKGTQCDLIVKNYGWAHFSAGDLLRAQVKAGTEMGKQAEEYLKAGTMVPASMIIGLLKEALSDAQHTKVLIDGFPRVLDQLKDFEQQVRPCDTALFYNVPEEEAKERLLKRGQTSGRVDDNEETIHNRFIVFKEESMPVITELEKEGRAVEINAAQTPEQVFEATRQVIEQLEQKQASRAKQPEPAAAFADTAAAAAGAAVPAVAGAAAAVASPVTPAVQSPRASVTPTGASPVAAAAAVGSSPASPQAAATAGDAAAAPAASASPAAAAQSPGAPASPVAAGSAAVSAVSSPVQAAVGSPVAATAAPAADAAFPTAAGAVPAAAALTAAAAGAAAAAAASSPAESETAQADTTAAPAAAPPAVVVPAEVAGVPAQLDVMSPTAAGAASPSPRATLASLHVDLSGIRTPIVICGPSGVGKGTLISKLMEQHPERFGFSVSHTTRGPRPGEVHGKHYYFTEKEAMSAQVAAGMFLEHADVHGNMYGTSLAAVAQVSAAGKHCVLDIDVQGAAQVRKSALGPHCLFIFVAPPSHDELERRLRNRGTETEDKVLQRLANAESEIAKAQEPGLFHHVLVNADLETAYQELQKLVAPRVPGLLPDHQQTAVAAAGAGSKRTSEAGSASASTPKAAAAGNATATTPPAVSPVATESAGMAGIAAAAVAAATAALSPRQQQQQAALQAQPHPMMANGTASSAVTAAGGTSTLLDFGFGASAGPAVAAKGMPVRQYMDATVIPVLREGLKALNAARPDDPLQFLADYLVAHKAAAA